MKEGSNGITFTEVSKRFGKKLVLDQLTFQAKPGEITGLLGRNGAGKTTALRVLVGLIQPNSGNALINNSRFSSHVPGTIGVSVNAAFPPSRKVADQLRVTGLAYDVAGSRIHEVLETMQLQNILKTRCGRLSMGMKQRLSIACAILKDPHTLILDEPVNGLDPDGIRWLHNFLRQEADKGKTVLVSSHYLHDMEQYVDHVVIIQREILWEGLWPNASEESLEEVFRQVTKEIEIA